MYHVENTAAVAAIIDDRIYPLVRHQGDPAPALTYHVVDTIRLHAHDGPSRMFRSRVQFDGWSPDRLQAHAITDALLAELDGFKGLMGPAGEIRIHDCFFDSGGDRDYDDDTQLFHVRNDYRIRHEEV